MNLKTPVMRLRLLIGTLVVFVACGPTAPPSATIIRHEEFKFESGRIYIFQCLLGTNRLYQSRGANISETKNYFVLQKDKNPPKSSFVVTETIALPKCSTIVHLTWELDKLVRTLEFDTAMSDLKTGKRTAEQIMQDPASSLTDFEKVVLRDFFGKSRRQK